LSASKTKYLAGKIDRADATVKAVQAAVTVDVNTAADKKAMADKKSADAKAASADSAASATGLAALALCVAAAAN